MLNSLSMNSFHIPALLIHPVPPPLLTSEPGSFAQNTLAVRIPRILQETIEENDFPLDILNAMQALQAELARGVIQPLREDTPDRDFWNAVSRDCIGRSWLDVPWFWAETYFYRRVLETMQYFQPGDWYLVDPYRVKKQADLASAPGALTSTHASLPEDRASRFERLLHLALWGNRTDLSYNVGASIQQRAHEAELENVLVDDTALVWDYCRSGLRRIVFITDNTGTELLNDLALVDFMLTEGIATEIVMHLKAQPYFVSDAMPTDVEISIDALAGGGEPVRSLGRRLRGYVDQKRLKLTTHWFYTTCLHYFQLPGDLIEKLAAADLVILKGDANYRRLVGDAHWAPTASFREATAYFPAPLVSLRTLKAEVVLGLTPGLAENLAREDPNWMVNGRRGLVQASKVKVG